MIALLLLLAIPHDTVQTHDVDLIEVNHYYDGDGRPVFKQAIFWDFHDDGNFHVRDWRLLTSHSQIPTPSRGQWSATWRDGDVLRRVRTGSVRQRWTQFDPELEDRNELPKEHRRGVK